MADAPAFESSIVSPPSVASDSVTLTDVSATAKTIIRAAADTVAAEQLGVRFGSSRRDGDTLVLGQRPGEWLVLDDAGLVTGLDTSGHVSVIDHTHSRALLRLTGPDAAATLEKICGLDWSDAMTPNGAVMAASVAKVTCDLARDDVDGTPSYLIACDRSFGQYLADAIADAAAEFAR